ncbi:MAG: hypothetical protein WC364_14315 [Eubacteriales bacterium]
MEVPLPSIEVSRVFPVNLGYMPPLITTTVPAAACSRFFTAGSRLPLVEAGSPTATAFSRPPLVRFRYGLHPVLAIWLFRQLDALGHPNNACL